MKERLLFISRKWPPAVGGMESYSVSLAESLEPHFDTSILVLPGRSDGRPPGLLAYALFLLRAMAHVLLHGRKYRHLVLGDLVLFPAALVSRLVAPKQSRSVVLYGLDLVYQQRSGLLPKLYGCFFSLFSAFQGIFTAKVAISSYTRQLAVKAGLSGVHVINPCLPESPLTASSPDASLLPPAFAASDRRILYFGRLVPRKGAEWFASEVLPALPEQAAFFVVGAPTDPAYHQRLVRHPRVHYLGRQPDAVLASLIAHADLVVMPNIPTPDSVDAEGFGLVAVEAASLGAILVASRLQGIVDAVVDGKTGILVTSGDATAWRETLVALLGESGEQRQSRRDLAASTCRDVYSLEKLGSSFAALLPCSPTTAGNSDDAGS